MYIPCSECSIKRVFDMDNIETSNVLLSVHDDTRPSHIASASKHNNVSGIKLDIVSNLALIEIIFDGIVGLNIGIGVANCASIVGDDVGNTTIANSYSADF